MPQHMTLFLSSNPCQAAAIGYIWRARFNQDPQGFQLVKLYEWLLCVLNKCISLLSIAVIHTANWYGKITEDAETTQGR